MLLFRNSASFPDTLLTVQRACNLRLHNLPSHIQAIMMSRSSAKSSVEMPDALSLVSTYRFGFQPDQ